MKTRYFGVRFGVNTVACYPLDGWFEQPYDSGSCQLLSDQLGVKIDFIIMYNEAYHWVAFATEKWKAIALSAELKMQGENRKDSIATAPASLSYYLPEKDCDRVYRELCRTLAEVIQCEEQEAALDS